MERMAQDRCGALRRRIEFPASKERTGNSYCANPRKRGFAAPCERTLRAPAPSTRIMRWSH